MIQWGPRGPAPSRPEPAQNVPQRVCLNRMALTGESLGVPHPCGDDGDVQSREELTGSSCSPVQATGNWGSGYYASSQVLGLAPFQGSAV